MAPNKLATRVSSAQTSSANRLCQRHARLPWQPTNGALTARCERRSTPWLSRCGTRPRRKA
eukprot:13723004-Heterocapsa_arctica.AAC.1